MHGTNDSTDDRAIAQKIGDFMSAWEEFKSTNDARLQDLERRGTADVLFGEKLGRIELTLGQFESKNAAITLASGRRQALRVVSRAHEKIQRQLRARANASEEAYKSAFLDYCQRGDHGASEASVRILNDRVAQYKALVAGQDTLGGYYLAPPALELEIIKAVILMSPLRALARVSKIGVQSWKGPKRTGVFAAVRASEQAQRNETAGYQTGMVEITAPEFFALAILSLQMMEDSAFDLDEEMNAEFAEQFAVAEGKEFIAGTGGAEQAEGVLTNAQVNVVHSGQATTFSADSLINLFFNGLKTAYAQRATWVMNRQTLGAVRQLKDGNGQYLWMPGIAGGEPNTVLGAPYAEMPDMPSVGAGTTPIAVGDFKRGYRVVDRLELGVLRDPYTSAGVGQVKLWARKRVGGGVTLGEAIAKLLIAA
jgi:HK97 family phage major capsid protein